MFSQLMRSRRFAPLFWCQFFSAFNDNFVRQMLAMLILFRFGGEDAGAKVALGVAIFVLPSIPLSPIGGEFADAHDKAAVARRLKLAEIFVQLVAAAGFCSSRSSCFTSRCSASAASRRCSGRSNTASCPTICAPRSWSPGNALVEGGDLRRHPLRPGDRRLRRRRGALGVERRRCSSSSSPPPATPPRCYIPPTGVGAPGLKSTTTRGPRRVESSRELRADDRQWVGAMAVSWFWMVGAITLSLVPVIVKSRIGGGVEVETAITSLLRHRRRRRIAARRALVARPHPTRAGAVPAADRRGAQRPPRLARLGAAPRRPRRSASSNSSAAPKAGGSRSR